jgi:hypothetical protein
MLQGREEPQLQPQVAGGRPLLYRPLMCSAGTGQQPRRARLAATAVATAVAHVTSWLYSLLLLVTAIRSTTTVQSRSTCWFCLRAAVLLCAQSIQMLSISYASSVSSVAAAPSAHKATPTAVSSGYVRHVIAARPSVP